jgi:hypothetical protein
MEKVEEILRDYALGYGGASEVSPELRSVMSKNSESAASVLAARSTRKALDSDSRLPIADSCSQKMGAINAGR